MNKQDTTNHTKIRHVRVPEQVWRDATERAHKSNMTISEVVRELLVGYVEGDYRL